MGPCDAIECQNIYTVTLGLILFFVACRHVIRYTLGSYLYAIHPFALHHFFFDRDIGQDVIQFDDCNLIQAFRQTH